MFLNSTIDSLSSINEIESNFFLRHGTNKTSYKSKLLPDSSWKGIVPTPATRYLASSPTSTCIPQSYSVRLENYCWASYDEPIILIPCIPQNRTCRNCRKARYH